MILSIELEQFKLLKENQTATIELSTFILGDKAIAAAVASYTHTTNAAYADLLLSGFSFFPGRIMEGTGEGKNLVTQWLRNKQD